MRLILAGLVVVTVAGCRNLEVPEQQARAAVAGTLDLQGHRPNGGHEIVLTDTGGGQRAATTGEAGGFTFTDLAPGAYFLGVNVQGYAPLVVPGLRVGAGQTLDAGTLAPVWLLDTPDEASLRGLVSANGGGSVEGARVEFRLGADAVATTTVGSDGRFVMRLPPATYLVRASHPHFVTAELADVVLASGATVDLESTPLVLDVNPGTLAGRVLREVERMTPAPAVGATVTLNTGQTTVVDQAGNFTLTGLAAGPRTVTVQLAGHVDPQEQRVATIEPGKTADLGTVTLRLVRGGIEGTVALADGSPVAGATVALAGTPYSAVVSPRATAPSSGEFVIENLPAGTYQVVAMKDRYSRATATVTVSGSGLVSAGTLTLTLLQGDFDIEDTDPDNLAGYTRTRAVTLNFTGFPSTGVAEYRASEDATFAGGAAPWLPYTGPTQAFTLSDADGQHAVYAQYRDGVGSASQVFASAVVLDRVAPLVSSVAFQATGAVGMTRFTSRSSNIPLAIFGTDELSGVGRMRVGPTRDGAGAVQAMPQPYLSGIAVSPMPIIDEPKTVWVQLLDNAGNASVAVSDTIVVDTAAPTGTLLVLPGARAQLNGYTHTPLVTLQLTAATEPNGGALVVRLANATGLELDSASHQPLSPTLAWFLSPTPDGAKTVHAVLRDAAGNESQPLSAPIVLDTAAPTPAIASLVGGQLVRNDPNVVLQLTTDTSDLAPDSGVTVSEDPYFLGATPRAFPTGGTVSLTLAGADGPRTVSVRYRDRAGNDSFAAVPVTLDRVTPTVSMVVTGTRADGTASSTHTSTSSVTVQLSASEPVEYVLGNDTLGTCPSTGWQPLPPSGAVSATLSGTATPRQVRACVRDAARNLVGPLTASITLDSVAPAGCTVQLAGRRADGSGAAPPAGRTGRPDIGLTISGCAEAPAEFSLTTGAVPSCTDPALPWTPFSASSGLSLVGADGAFTVRGCVRDAARNAASLVEASITLDTTPPQAPFVTIDQGAEYLNDATALSRGGNIGQVTGAAVGAVEWALAESVAGLTTWLAFPATSPRNFTFAGTGARSVYAVFRDDVGNASAVVSDGIVIDRTAPVGGSFAINSPTGNAFINSVSALLRLTPPPDATGMSLAEALSGSCTATTFAGAPVTPFASSATLLLSPGDGLKRACARFTDAAGNASAPLEATATLDATPPTQPQITTQGDTLNQPNGSTFAVTTRGPVTEANFARYELLGGSLDQWTPGPTSIGTTSFTFQLVSSALAPTGTPNTLRLRAVDLAGNVSAEDLVVITTDVAVPVAVTLDTRWVDNGDGRGTVHWTSSASPDVVAYKVYYGATTSVGVLSGYRGANALQGTSPLTVPARSGPVQSFTLGGLANNTTTHVTVTAVDHAGNESLPPAPASPPREVVITPGEVSPSLVARVQLSGGGAVINVRVVDDYAYVVSNLGACAPTGPARLSTVALGAFASQVQGGSLSTGTPAPTVTAGPVDLGTTGCLNGFASGAPMAVLWPYLFIATNQTLHVFNLLTPSSPTSVQTLALGHVVTSLSVVGLRLFAVGGTSSSAVMLNRLFDGAAGNLLASDVLGPVTNGYTEGRVGAVSRNRLVVFAQSGGTASTYDLSAPLAGAAWANTSRINQFTSLNVAAPALTFGDFLYASAANFSIYRLATLWGSSAPGTGLTSGDLVAQSPIGTGKDARLLGEQLFLANSTPGGLVTATTADLSSMRRQSLALSNPSGVPQLDPLDTWGSYALVGASTGNELLVYELGAPRSLSVGAQAPGSNTGLSVHPGFVLSGTAAAFDMHKGGGLGVEPATTVLSCVWSSVQVDDDVRVAAYGTNLLVVDTSPLTDRSLGTSFTDAANVVQLPIASGRVTGVAAVGNALLLALVRADGVYLEVHPATALRDRLGSSAFSLGAPLGSVRVWSGVPGAADRASVSVSRGHALVSFDNASGGVFLVDLRPVLDDVAGGTLSVGGQLAAPGASTVSAKGGYLYFGSTAGLRAADVTQALDDDPMTVLPASPPMTTVSNQAAQFTAAYGGWLFTAHASSGVRVFDVRTPGTPSLQVSAGGTGSVSTCSPGIPPTQVQRYGGLAVAGSRLYFSTGGELTLLDFE